MKNYDKSLSKERGQSLVEFAVMLVVLMVMVTGIVDAARALFTYLAMRDAAQEGALYGSAYPCDEGGISNRVQHTSTLIEGIWSDLEVTTETMVKECVGGAIRVTVAYDDFPLTMPFIGAFVGGQTVPISASVVDTILSPSCPNTCP